MAASSCSGVATTGGTPSTGSVSRTGSSSTGGVGEGASVNVSAFGSVGCGGTASAPPRPGSGGSPAVVHNSSAQAARCGGRPTPSSSSGVQDARTSTSARGASSAMPPKDSLVTDVTVPLGAVYSALWAARASISQDQPTLPISGSVTISGSTSARAKVTQRNVPCQAALPAGSCRSTSRPLPASSPPTITSAVIAAANGAIRCGAGIGSTDSSGRQVGRGEVGGRTPERARAQAWVQSWRPPVEPILRFLAEPLDAPDFG